jgi:hypothetical protein
MAAAGEGDALYEIRRHALGSHVIPHVSVLSLPVCPLPPSVLSSASEPNHCPVEVGGDAPGECLFVLALNFGFPFHHTLSNHIIRSLNCSESYNGFHEISAASLIVM